MLDKVTEYYGNTCDYYMIEPNDEKRKQTDIFFSEFQKIGNDIAKIENTKSKHSIEYSTHAEQF